MMTEQQAIDAAEALVARMGDGWVASVWQNFGWHYCVRRGDVTIRPHYTYGSDDISYSAWIEPRNAHIGRNALQIIASGPTPDDALGNAVQDARTMMSRLTAALDQLREIVS